MAEAIRLGQEMQNALKSGRGDATLGQSALKSSEDDATLSQNALKSGVDDTFL